MDYPLAASRRCDSTKAGGIERRVAIGEVRIVENVDERRLDFKTDLFAYREPLSDARVKIEESSAIYAVEWEVAKRTGRGLAQQPWFEC